MKLAKILIGLVLFLVSITSAAAWHEYTYDGYGGYFYRYGYDAYQPHVSTVYRGVGYYYPTNYVGEHWSYPSYSYGYSYQGYASPINYARPYYYGDGRARYYPGGNWPNYAQTRYYW